MRLIDKEQACGQGLIELDGNPASAIPPSFIGGKDHKVPETFNICRAIGSLYDLGIWIQRLKDYLDPRLILEVAPRFNIVAVDFEDPQGWQDGAIARIGNDGGDYYLSLNPNLDKAVAAKWLSKRIGLPIKPEEVYTFAFFHECGHTAAAIGKRLSAGSIAALGFRLGENIEGEEITWDLIAQRRTEAEIAADEWAIKEFKKWSIFHKE